MAQWYANVDGEQYGPATAEEMRCWVEQGRVKPTDYVWAEGMAGWVTASEAFGVTPSGGSDSQTVYVPTTMPNAPFSVASMVCGIVGMVMVCLYGIGFVVGIVAWVLASKSRGIIRRNPGQFSGEGMAMAGLVLGIISTILGILYIAVYVGFLTYFRNF